MGVHEMKGINELHLNHETLVAAVQVWVNSVFAEGEAPEVKSVKRAMNEYTFIVEIEGENDGNEEEVR